MLQHLEEMIPVICIPTVGKACEHYSHIPGRAEVPAPAPEGVALA